MAPLLASRVGDSWRQARSGGRIGLSDFSHGRKWREDLGEAGIMEIVDRGETAGWLVSDASLGEVVELIDQLEGELEQARVAALFAARRNRESWATGDELAEKAKASLLARDNLLRDVAHVD